MADVSGITGIKPGSDARIELVEYGATVAIGNTLYLDTSDNSYKLADADASATAAKAKRIAITAGGDGDAGVVLISGSATLVGATLTQGAMYIVSDTPGGIKPDADRTTGDYVTNIGRASSSSVLVVDFESTEIQVP